MSVANGEGARRAVGATPAPNRRRPVDLAHLAKHTLGDRALEREVLELFRGQSRLYLRRLAEAEDDGAWRDAAHTIKGSARGIGAWPLAEAAEAAEALRGANRMAGRAGALARLARAVEETNAHIGELLADG